MTTKIGINGFGRQGFRKSLTMDWKVLGLVFGTVLISELGDKTQLATLLFAADKEVSKWLVFFGASLALGVTSALGVLGGSLILQYVSEKNLHVVTRRLKWPCCSSSMSSSASSPTWSVAGSGRVLA